MERFRVITIIIITNHSLIYTMYKLYSKMIGKTKIADSQQTLEP
jgi:hypothetical protein